MNLRYLILLVPCMLISLCLNAQEKQIQGTVKEYKSSETLIGAHVMLQQNWRVGTVTDAQGSFILTIPDSLYHPESMLIISFVGHREQTISIADLVDNNVVYLDSKEANLEAITIRADKLIAEEFTVQKLERMDIYTNPSAKGDALLAVNALPSSTTLDESANVSFRGTSPNQTGIFFNGVPLYDAVRFSQLNGIGTFSLFNTAILKSVHVFPGNPPLEFGNVSSGLIALSTTDRVPVKNNTSVITTLANVGVNHNRKLGSNSGLTIYSNLQFSGPLKKVNQESLENINDFNSIDLGFHFINKDKNGRNIKFFNYSLIEGYDVNFKAPTFQGDVIQDRFKNISIFNYLQPLQKGVLTVNSGYTFTKTDISFSASTYDIVDQNIFTSLNYHLELPTNSFKTGFSYDGRLSQFDGSVPIYEEAIRPTDPHILIETKNERHLIEYFAFHNFQPNENFSFGQAVRTNIPTQDLPHYISFQSHLAYELNPQHELKFSGGKLHQAIINYEGAKPRLIRSWQASLDHHFETDDLENTNSIFFNSNRDSLETKIVGIETAWEYTGIDNLLLQVSYTAIDSRRFNGENGIAPGTYDINYFVRLGAEYDLGYWTLGTRALFRQGSYFYPVNNTEFNSDLNFYQTTLSSEAIRLPAYNLIDLNLSRLIPISESLTLVAFASVNNIIDFENVRAYTYNFDYSSRSPELFSQRTFFIGCSFNFL